MTGRPEGGHPPAADAPPELVIPAGALIVLIGAAGSGKSTFAAASFPPEAVLSSDSFRARLGRGEADQSVTGAAFAALHGAVERRLSAGRTTVVDATSLTTGARQALLERARQYGALPIAIVLDLPSDLVVARNAGRVGRVVPESAVRRQLGMLRAITDELLQREGFASVRRLRSSDAVAGLHVVLVPR